MSRNSTRRFTVKTYNNEEYTRTANRMRSWLYSLARRRSTGTVTADLHALPEADVRQTRRSMDVPSPGISRGC